MKNKYLLREIADIRRFMTLGFNYENLLDPDKILAENNYDYSILRDLMSDPHLIAAIQQRKMQVMQMGWEVENTENEELKIEILEMLRRLPLQQIMNEILNAIYYGFVVMEIVWKIEGGKYVPAHIKAKPQEWFIFTKDSELRLRKRINGNYIFEEGEKLPKYKFLLIQNQPSYSNPYGEKILSKCYWPVILKREAMEFWQLMVERFGMPYIVGRSSIGSTPQEREELLEELEKMAEDLITVIDADKTIELIENPKYEAGELYDKLLNFYNSEISKAVLTVTLTTDVGKVGSYKAADIHREMLSYIGVSDKKLVEKAINDTIRYYCILNHGVEEAPTVKLTKKEAVVEESAERDKILSEIGVEFTKEYFMKRYNLSERDFRLVNRELKSKKEKLKSKK